jgi:hypothetical protein
VKRRRRPFMLSGGSLDQRQRARRDWARLSYPLRDAILATGWRYDPSAGRELCDELRGVISAAIARKLRRQRV